MAPINLGSVGDYIREQRKLAQYSLRQLSHAAGVSNPYLSQIERGLRKPSAEILQQIARALRISAETLYVRAGILDDTAERHEAVTAIVNDTALTERQKRVLIELYDTFRKENELHAEPEQPTTESETQQATTPPGPGADPNNSRVWGPQSSTAGEEDQS